MKGFGEGRSWQRLDVFVLDLTHFIQVGDQKPEGYGGISVLWVMTMVVDDLAFSVPIWVESIPRVERNRQIISRVVTGAVVEPEISQRVFKNSTSNFFFDEWVY